MISKELFRKIKQIEITTKRLVTDVFAGQYHSVFKGQGIEFDEVREYNIGDDIRSIDWNVTARTGRAHIKKFIEERELTVMILVDVSPSSRFASVKMLKAQLAAEICALLALSAIRNNDKVGVIFFTDQVEKFIPPRKGTRHVLRVVREVLYFNPKGQATNIAGALEYLNKVSTRKTIAFLISDFFDAKKEELKMAMAIANRRHDLTAFTLNDPREFKLPDSGLMTVCDAETGQLTDIDTSSQQLRDEYQKRNRKRISEREELLRSLGVDFVNLSTDGSYADEMVRFFRKRRGRRY